jgi:RHS repeat-associated protein
MRVDLRAGFRFGVFALIVVVFSVLAGTRSVASASTVTSPVWLSGIAVGPVGVEDLSVSVGVGSRAAGNTGAFGEIGFTYGGVGLGSCVVADGFSGVLRGSDAWSYVYDAAGNVTSRVLPDGVTRTAVFDDGGQQTSVSDPAGTVSFSYGLAGHLTGMTLPGGVSQTRSIDRAGRVASIVNTGPTGPIGGFAYTRDANGNPTGVDVSGPAGIVATESTRNTFDAFDRLTRTCFTVSTCTSANQTVWTFDKNSNRLTQKVGTAAQSTYTYNSADELTAIGGPGASSFTYNANGDQVAAGADVFGYNTLRQPTSATVAGVTSTFSYDGNGDRATITTGGVARSEVWDGVDGMSVLVAERNGTGGLLRSYTHVGGVPARYTDHGSNSTGFYLTDTLGSVSNLTTGTGTVAGTYRYDPYGAARASTSVTAPFAGNPLKFTGQQQDPTGLYNLRARHYNPATGRFTQTDPLARTSGAYLNAYEYANLNPWVFVDPTGLRGKKSCGAPSLLRQWQIRGQALNPWSDFTDECELLQARAVFMGDATGIVPVAEKVGYAAAGFVLVASGAAIAGAAPAVTLGVPSLGLTGSGALGIVVTPVAIAVPAALGGSAGAIVAGTAIVYAKRVFFTEDDLNNTVDGLTEAEKEAVRNRQAGDKFDDKAWKSAKKKLEKTEKYNDERNVGKNRGQPKK